MIRPIVSSVICVLLINPSVAGEPVGEVLWPQLERQGMLHSGEVQPDGTLVLESDQPGEKRLPVATLEPTGISQPVYALRGEVRYTNVSPESFLEMQSYFPDDGPFYTRTLAEGGLLRTIEGMSDWREFVLPFYGADGEPAATKLELNLVLTGPGRVELRPLRLIEYDAGEDPMRAAGAWWGDRPGGLIGGVLGAVLGCLGALIGVLAGTGRARAITLGLLVGMGGLGIVLLAAGVVALAVGQPYGVFYPLVLSGLIASILGFALLPGVRRRYEQKELRRMSALDAS
jgi:hypothetical protein